MVLATDSAQLDVAELKQHVSAMAVFLRQHEWLPLNRIPMPKL
jgi:hypothetical protein